MSGIQLKSDNHVQRYVDRGARYECVEPLTKGEKDRLAENCWEKCRNSYKIRMIKSGLLSDYETFEDLESEAYIFMWNILDKFDKSKCGKIAKFDEPGAKAPKTLEFYFKNYFYGRVNFTAAEARDYKKKRGVGPRGVVQDLVYDQDYSGEYGMNLKNLKYESTEEINNFLKDKSENFVEFLQDSWIEQYTQNDLKDKWRDKYSSLKSELTKFKKDMKDRFHKNYLEEIGKLDDYIKKHSESEI